MSATEDDTELRDLLIQNLENNGLLNKLKAEMRAAVFLAMEEQDKLENKTPLVNENLKKCLNTKDGRLVAGLIVDFLQVFHLDFSLAVFQPEINSVSGGVSREQLCRDLGLGECEGNRKSPLLLELVKRGQEVQASEVRRSPPALPKAEAGSVGGHFQPPDGREQQQQQEKEQQEEEGDDHEDDGDSFFDDPLPKPQKTYGWKEEAPGARGSPAGSLSENQRPGGGGSSASEHSHSRNGASRQRGCRDSKTPNDKTASLHLEGEEDYDDDFNSHRSDLSRSELSIGEEIDEVSIEGPETSDKLEDATQDLSVSQLSLSHGVDYMEAVP
ncbi:FGFR1 oncogene partner isoform X2 [Eleginops maclovinus]|uniref:FGFR1 oncogene partner isoform X2 n=1 Tax=Eleginops maclovinus TaxID=56733 RepID=UPI00308053AE